MFTCTAPTFSFEAETGSELVSELRRRAATPPRFTVTWQERCLVDYQPGSPDTARVKVGLYRYIIRREDCLLTVRLFLNVRQNRNQLDIVPTMEIR